MSNNTGSKNSIISGQSTPTKSGLKPDVVNIQERGNWENPLEFTLACIGYAIGLGNVWRFPQLVFRNGGGAFLVPYILMVLVIGLPIFFAELFVGQYSGLGPIRAYEYLAPIFHGLGYCTLVVITFVTIYYMVIIAWIIFYFVASFSPELGWSHCNHNFNTDKCYTSTEEQRCNINNTGHLTDMIYWKRQCMQIADICLEKGYIPNNGSHCTNATTSISKPIRQVVKRVLASEEYYYQNVLGIGDAKWDNFGVPRWQLVICLAAGWLIAFFCLSKGIKSAGKVVYFTALFPYVILTSLLIRSATLPGAGNGIYFYITPDWSKLLEPYVWGDAASQTFYSFGLACNSLVSFASYSHFKNNCHRDTVIVSLANVFTAIFSGFAVFSTLGFMAHNLGVDVREIVQDGPGLAFIAYPEAVLLMPMQNLWAILFFFMMFILGMGSQFGGIESLCTAITDQWPYLRDQHWKVTAGVCLACFIAGLPMVCDGGVYLFTLLDWHTASWAILLLGIAEVVVLSWVYGINRTFDNLSDMDMHLTGIIRWYWWSSWMILTPIASLAVFVFVMTGIKPTQFDEYIFPKWADVLGWMVGASTLLPFVCFVIYGLWKGQTLRMLLVTQPEWTSQEYVDPQNAESALTSTMDVNKFYGIDNVGFQNIT